MFTEFLPMEMLVKWGTERPNDLYLRQPINREYKDYSWGQTLEAVARMAGALKAMGLPQGSRVAIISSNVAEWFIADYAIQAAGMISTPIYDTASADTINYVLTHSEAPAIFVGKLKDPQPALNGIPDNVTKIALPYETIPADKQWNDLMATDPLPIEEFAKPAREDVWSIVYTSGSTGNPKGVELTYENIIYGATGTIQALGNQPGETMISYLPLAHIAERGVIQYLSLYNCQSVHFNESLETFAEDLRNVSPRNFFSVPRLWMKFYSGILAKLPQAHLDAALADPAKAEAVKLQLQQGLGLDKCRTIGSGAAPISKATIEWFNKIGIPLSEGWGMTETSGLVSTHVPFREDKIGTIGKPFPGMEVRLGDNEELQIRGPGIMKGYYKEPEKTAETFTEDGWLRTGDQARIDDEGYMYITGRVKEIFKTAKAKYVAPVPIEAIIFDNTYVEQACVMGSALPQPVAVVCLSPDSTQGVSEEEIEKTLLDTLQKVNSQVEGHEALDAIVVAKDSWTVENGLLTPTLKIRRSPLEARYESIIANTGGQPVVWEAKAETGDAPAAQAKTPATTQEAPAQGDSKGGMFSAVKKMFGGK